MALLAGKNWQAPDVPPRLQVDYFERVRALPSDGLSFPDRDGAAHKVCSLEGVMGRAGEGKDEMLTELATMPMPFS